jgi:hypothetical protein
MPDRPQLCGEDVSSADENVDRRWLVRWHRDPTLRRFLQDTNATLPLSLPSISPSLACPHCHVLIRAPCPAGVDTLQPVVA